MLARARLWLRSHFLRRRLEAEMQLEMAQHLDRSTDLFVARGMSNTEAHHAAKREFGNMTYLKEEGRRSRGTGWVEALAADSRFAIRHFRRNPGATLTMLVVLAIGMSIGTSLFSFMRSYATQPPLGVSRSDDLVRIRGRNFTDGLPLRTVSLEELEEYRRLTTHFAAVAGYMEDGVTIAMHGNVEAAESATATFVTPNYFDVLGVRLAMGGGLPRTESEQTQSEAIAVVSDAVWAKFFARTPDVIGKTLIVDGARVTIAGVSPPRFAGVGDFGEMKIWMPVASRPLVGRARLLPGTEAFAAVARLAPGSDPELATVPVDVIAKGVTATLEQTRRSTVERRVGADVVPLLATNVSPEFDSEVRGMSFGAAVLGTLLLLVTCANVSALQTGLALMRRREIAVRLSMGASRRRIVRQLLTETTILATLAGGAALGLVQLIQQAMVTQLPNLPIEIAVNGPVLAFVFGLALAVGTLFGLAPALHATRIPISSALKDSTTAIAAPRVRLQRGLVVAQIALTQPLIVVLGITVLQLWKEYQGVGLTESGERIVAMRLAPAGAQVQDSTAPRWANEMRGLQDRLRATPSIEGAVQNFQQTRYLGTHRVHPGDRAGAGSEQLPQLSAPTVAPGYFDVMGIRLVLGRDFTESDRSPTRAERRADVPVVIGSDLASALWGAASPLGRRLQSAVDTLGDRPTLTVIGVVQQTKDEVGEGNQYEVFLPAASGRADSALSMLIRTRGEAAPLIPSIRQLVEQQTSRLVIADVTTVAEMEAEDTNLIMLGANALGASGFLILFLAAIGLFAVVSFAVGQRTSEIAIRMAVGAGARQIVGKFIGEGLRLGVIGLIIGLPLSLIGLHLLMTRLDGSTAPMAGIAATAGIVILTVALAATWFPARRAAAVDPASVLRRD